MAPTKKTQAIASVSFSPPSDTSLGVEAMSIDDLRKRATAEHFEKLQRADFYRLIGVLEGSTNPMVDFSTYAARAGDWLLVRPGQVFRYDFSHLWSGWLLVFRPDSLSPVERSRLPEYFDLRRRIEDLASLHSLRKDQHNWLSNSVQQMKFDAGFTDDVRLRNELLRLSLAGLLLRLSLWQSSNLSLGTSHVSNHANFRRFRQLLDADFATNHQVHHYAAALGMSDKTLSRVCISATGTPAKAVINQRLVLEAKRLLAHTGVAVQTIGRELGFDEASNFIKFFRKEAGITPLAFRQKNSHS